MTCYGHFLIYVRDKVTMKYHPIGFYMMNTDVPRILISHAASYWLGLVRVLCDNKVPWMKRQVASIDKKSDFRAKSSPFRTSTLHTGNSSQKPWIEKLKDSTQKDPIHGTVYQLTQQGWPHRHIPHLVRRYWDFRGELSTDDGLLLKGVSTPSTWRPSLCKQGTREHKGAHVLARNQCRHRGLHQEMPGMYQVVSSNQKAWHGLFQLQWEFLHSNLWLFLKVSLYVQSKNFILLIKGPSNQSFLNYPEVIQTMDHCSAIRSLPSFSLAWASSTPPYPQGIHALMVSLSITYKWLKYAF